MRHNGSLNKVIRAERADAFEDGVCHAIDELREIARAEQLLGNADEANAANRMADRLEANLFRPQVVE